MKTLDPANEAALAQTTVHPRDFLELTVKDRSTGADVIERLWSGNSDVTATVYDPDSGSNLTTTWKGAAGFVSMDMVPMVASLVIQEVRITMEAVGSDIDRIVQTYEPKLAKVRAWRGYIDPTTLDLAGPAEPRFFGVVDEIERPRPADGDEGQVILTCKSHAIEATRTNPDTRSDESQRRRNATDNFFQDVNAMRRRVFKI